MHIGILETGEVTQDLQDLGHGAYPPLFEALIGQSAEGFTFETISVVGGAFPTSPTQCEGWIVTGSRHGVYDGLPWIEPLMQFLRDCMAARAPLAGICFGHQIIAEAMGGKVVKSDRGWGVGVHAYEVKAQPSWMTGLGQMFAGRAVHQDQVIERPENATVLASSAFCEYAALVYGDVEAPAAITVQPHPEFSAEFVADIVRTRMPDVIPEDRGQAALATLSQPVHNAEWGTWLARFFLDAKDRV
ncbi:type 1 glutamine amidotransferase [Pontivivens insulae]|uniref:Carbamoyl-phosphate synthase small chain n=1 Tax=Pontivivens insulae TaxID=1639689 RepID=A0A2R8A995_9RHOB|nr:GMP synthase [Pontivivens insulae]RED12711.1 GMP synthase-like glutamine amidotransferase [Pontivivens insulae]SPF28802.1 Carbamoyl-phosphate synthase small chain [Pontivivens insulae]